MVQIISRGESVYQCDVCSRHVRVPTNKYSISVVNRCTITLNCPGHLHRVISTKEINETPANPPSVPGLQDWFQRKVLYTHEQVIETVTWKVKHDLGVKPSVQIFMSQTTPEGTTITEIDPQSIVIDDLNNLTVTFAQPTSGIAQCIASSSRNHINPNVHEEVIQLPTDMLLTNNGEITIATLDDSAEVDFRLMFRNPVSGTDTPVDYVDIGIGASLLSPWAGVSRVFVSGRRYSVRSFNIVTTPNAQLVFGVTPVANGSPVFFDNVLPLRDNVLILLGKPPFSAPDRITNQYIDVANISSTLPQLYYDAGDVLAPDNLPRKVYPHIVVAS